MSDAVREARRLCPPRLVEAWVRRRPGRVAALTALLWTQLVGAWWLALAGPAAAWPLAFLVICACVSGMQLWVHESSHYTLFTSRRLNDAWADVFFASPIGMSVRTYRRFHLTHHAHLGSPKDMDRFAFNVDVRGPKRLAAVLLRGLSGAEGARIVANKYLARDTARADRAGGALLLTAGWNAVLLAACILAGRWYLYPLLWAYPILAMAVTFNTVRSIGEHQPEAFQGVVAPDAHLQPVIRSTRPGPLEKWLLFQANFNHHFEHHLLPGVPATNLPDVRDHLEREGFYARHPEVVQRSAVAQVLRLSRRQGLEGATA